MADTPLRETTDPAALLREAARNHDPSGRVHMRPADLLAAADEIERLWAELGATRQERMDAIRDRNRLRDALGRIRDSDQGAAHMRITAAEALEAIRSARRWTGLEERVADLLDGIRSLREERETALPGDARRETARSTTAAALDAAGRALRSEMGKQAIGLGSVGPEGGYIDVPEADDRTVAAGVVLAFLRALPVVAPVPHLSLTSIVEADHAE